MLEISVNGCYNFHKYLCELTLIADVDFLLISESIKANIYKEYGHGQNNFQLCSNRDVI